MDLAQKSVDPKEWMMLRVLINRYNPRMGEALLRLLPEDEARAILSQNIRSQDIAPLLYQPQRLIEHMHYSWLKPVIFEQFPDDLRPNLLGALSPQQAIDIQPDLTPPILSEPVKAFFIKQLYDKLDVKHLTPLEYLPETELSQLAQWNKQGLSALADFLGLHDLTHEIRRIVSKPLLQNIYQCLNPKELSYLKICLHQKDKIVSPKLGIDFSKQNCEALRKQLHKRGLMRLGRALSGQHPDLVWYIAHRLDVGRGTLMTRSYRQEAVQEIVIPLKSQVVNLIHFLKKE